MAKYDLSVAIIFKNEIRCLERCLKSLQPLRERLSLQIVMADTGSDDGSRAVAERYADVLFDFPWINDFAAARNAVLDRCEGKWTLVIDCDEWVDRNTGELVKFLHSKQAQTYGDICDVETIQKTADKHGLKVIYDAAHAFGVTYMGKSVATFGDATMFI